MTSREDVIVGGLQHTEVVIDRLCIHSEVIGDPVLDAELNTLALQLQIAKKAAHTALERMLEERGRLQITGEAALLLAQINAAKESAAK